MDSLTSRAVAFLRWTERYTKTDMVYLFKGGGWLLTGQAFSLLASLSLAIVFGHHATQDTYGNYKYILSLATILGIISLSGLSTVVGRAVARGEEGALAQGFSYSIRYGGGVFAVSVIIALYYWLHNNTFVAASLLLVGFVSPFINGFSLYDAFFNAKRQFRTSALCLLGSLSVTTVVLIVTLLFLSQRAIVLVAVFFLTNLATDALWYLLARRQVANNRTDPDLKRYGLHQSVINLIDAIAGRIDGLVIFMFMGPIPLAVYSFAIALPEQFKGVVGGLANLSFPKFAARPLISIREGLGRRLIVLAIATTAVMGLYALIAPFLFTHLFPLYLESVRYSKWFAFTAIPTSITTMLVAILQAHRKTRSLYIISNTGSLSLAACIIAFVPLWGISGAIGAVFLSRTIAMLVAFWQFYKESNTEPAIS